MHYNLSNTGFPTVAVKKLLLLCLIPLSISVIIAYVFYPGFMSYDTLHALRGARYGVTDSIWPPMVSYVWQMVDYISLNPSAMHFAQVFLLLSCIFFTSSLLTQKVKYSIILLMLYLMIPVILGTLAVIWKDVLMASFFTSSFLMTLLLQKAKDKKIIIFLSFIIFLLLFLGTCSRHNAILGGVPLIFYFSFVLLSKFFLDKKYILLTSVISGIIILGVIFTLKTQLDRFSLPEFKKLNNSTDIFISTVRVLDIAGASICLEKNLFKDISPILTTDEIKNSYDPRHINLSKEILKIIPASDDRINQIWIKTALTYPICFLYNKTQLTKYLLGMNSGAQFLITDPSIIENEFNYKLTESKLRNRVVSYIVNSSKLFFFKPWFLYMIAVFIIIYMIKIKYFSLPLITLFTSGLMYLSGLIVFGNAADARLPFYTTSVIYMFVFISIVDLKRFYKDRKDLK